MNKQRGISTTLSILLVLLIIVVVGGVVVHKYILPWESGVCGDGYCPTTPEGQPSSNEPSTTTEPGGEDETADSKTYRNEEYGFEIKYPPSYEETVASKWILSGQPVATFYIKNKNKETTNVLNIAVFNDSFKNYKIIDQPGGFRFYFDTKDKKWLHLDGQTSEFIPKKVDVPIEAYIYKSGDIICGWDWIIVPHPSYSYVVEIANTTCSELYETSEGVFDYRKPEFILDSNQMLSTFRFLE